MVLWNVQEKRFTTKDLRMVSACKCEVRQHVLKKLEVSINPNGRDIQNWEIVNISQFKFIINNKYELHLGSSSQDGVNTDKAAQLTLSQSYYKSFNYQEWCEIIYCQVKPFGRYFTSK